MVKKGRMASQKENHKTLEEWAGSKHLILTLVFTDIVGSTEIGNSLGDTKWIEDLFVHFKRSAISCRFLQWLCCEGDR